MRIKLSKLIVLLCCTCNAKVAIRFVKAKTRWIETFFRRLISIFSRQSIAIGTSAFEGPSFEYKSFNLMQIN